MLQKDIEDYVETESKIPLNKLGFQKHVQRVTEKKFWLVGHMCGLNDNKTSTSCDGGISVLNHCLSWSKFVKTYLSHSRQWCNIHVLM